MPGVSLPGSAPWDPRSCSSGEGCWGWLRAQPAPSGREGMPWDPAVPSSEEASAGVPWKMQDAPGLGHNLLDECSGLSGLQFELFSGYFGFFCSINPLFKLGLPSWVYQSLAFSSVFLRLGDVPSRKVFPATAELCSLPRLGSESLGYWEDPPGRSCWDHRRAEVVPPGTAHPGNLQRLQLPPLEEAQGLKSSF